MLHSLNKGTGSTAEEFLTLTLLYVQETTRVEWINVLQRETHDKETWHFWFPGRITNIQPFYLTPSYKVLTFAYRKASSTGVLLANIVSVKAYEK